MITNSAEKRIDDPKTGNTNNLIFNKFRSNKGYDDVD